MISNTRKRTLAASAALLALLCIVVVPHFRAKWACEQYRNQLSAAGEKLDIQQLMPPWIARESNGVPVFRQAVGIWGFHTNLLDKNPPPLMRMVAPGKAMVGWAQPDVRSEGTSTWSQVEAATADFRDDLEVVRAAAQYTAFDFELNYREGPTLLLPHLAPLKRAVQRLAWEAQCDLHKGDAAAAATNIEAALSLVDATTGERLVISQLVRMAMAHIGVAATWELLQSTNATDAELAALQRHWAALAFIPPAEDSLEMERAFGQMILKRMRRSNSQFQQMASLGSRSGPGSSASLGDAILREVVTGAQATRWRMALSYPDELRSLKGHQAILDAFREVRGGLPFDEVLGHEKTRLGQLGLDARKDEFGHLLDPSGPNMASLFSNSVESLAGLLNRVLAIVAARDITVTALALRRYQIKHGDYPPGLAALVPDFVAAVPIDPADGQPLRYRPKSDGTYLLYSIGEDGVDNGGDATQPATSQALNWLRGRDWVWPQPAAPEEVSAFLEKNARKHGR